MRKMKLPKNVGNLLDSHLEIFRLPQGIKNFCLSEQIVYRKLSLGAPVVIVVFWRNTLFLWPFPLRKITQLASPEPIFLFWSLVRCK